ncbi:isoaspartyl peptidase/L-asparaginase family protein [Mesonia aestuariivivens]|uniref:Isoaspartyl peptidase/L-asparaginase n=1 Tax=Mesonia aestuariivivens TaxID=2796128 RepID=A0ABS6VXZ5_9FLAO|nr:isoaspartyl peptidase/L-asparaginase [Mesonia aestuariivivens]
MQEIAIALHGGAGTLINGEMTPEKEKEYKNVLSLALKKGYKVLEKKGNATDAVQTAVIVMENSDLFNAGKGSVFTADGTHEMEAAIMDGKTRQSGAVALVTGVKNPILLARAVMDKSQHVFLAGEGAINFAEELKLDFAKPEYFYNELRYQQWQKIKDSEKFQLDHSAIKNSKMGTVGCVALDSSGNLAAATSTGGMTNKKVGRLGDSGIAGAGNYANNKTCAVSCTGSGEYFIRGVVAYDVSCLIEMKGLSLEEATQEVIQKRILEIGGDGGLVAIDTQANISMQFNTEGMYRACKTSKGVEHIAIYQD